MTRDELVTEARFLIGQTDNTNTQFLDPVIQNQIDIAYRDFSRRTFILEDTEDITTTANQLEYQWTGQFFKLSQVRYIQTSGDIGRLLKPYPGGDNALPEFVQYGTPYYYVVRGASDTSEQKLIAWPVPDESSKTIRITGYLSGTTLLTGSTEPEFRKSYHHALSFYAAWKLLSVYQHKSGNARAKALDMKRSYFEIVSDAIADSSSPTEDGPIATVDVYA